MAESHRLERRSDLLASRMRDASDRFARQLGAGERPPFTTAMTKSESLAWWRQHRYDEQGQQALSRLQPWEVMRLDADLIAAMNPEEGVPGG